MNESEKTSLYRSLEEVPADALKEIKGGRLKGMSDISPQWRYERLTEIFGPCGFGWKYTIEKLWTEQGANGEIASFANINLFVKYEGEWSDSIPANGGSMFVANESKGPYVSDECFKMAITDAIGTASKMIGLAADIYRGKVNGNFKPQSKYENPPNQEPQKPEKPWLNKGEQLDKAMDYLRKGGTIEEIQKKYRISKSIMESLKLSIVS